MYGIMVWLGSRGQVAQSMLGAKEHPLAAGADRHGLCCVMLSIQGMTIIVYGHYAFGPGFAT